MKADLHRITLIEGDDVWILQHRGFDEDQLLSGNIDQVVAYAFKQGFTEVVEWSRGVPCCTHTALA